MTSVEAADLYLEIHRNCSFDVVSFTTMYVYLVNECWQCFLVSANELLQSRIMDNFNKNLQSYFGLSRLL